MHAARTQLPPITARAHRPPRFRLLRYFSLASLLGLVSVTVLLIWIYGVSTRAQLLEHESRANADLSAVFAAAVWARHRDFVLGSRGLTGDALRQHPGRAALDEDVRHKMGRLRVAKVKIYNLDGLTAFSTDERQIGEHKGGNAGFQAARAGTVISQVTFRERFDAFEGEIANRSLVASYIPLHSAGGEIESVLEVYSDVTELLQEQQRALWRIVGAVLACLAALYGFLYAVARKADRVISAQARDREVREAEARHQANHDLLTGLPNRAYFGERLAEALAQAARHQRNGALLFIDLDRFKIVNDSLGHAAGDALLEAVAERVGAVLRAGELLFRMGGDEFTVILPDIADAADAAHAAQRIVKRLAEPFVVLGHELQVGASVGIATFPGDGSDPETLLKNADAAMYDAKQAGRGTHAFYRREMNQRALHRLTLEAALQRGFRDGEFVLHYQPRVDASSRHVVALEALLRWASPARGLVPPGEFIGVLEDIGMMPIVGEWVLRTACTQLVHWQHEGRAPQRLSINVSPLQFRAAGFAASVERVLRETGAPATLVELELTESMLIHDTAAAVATIDALRRLGLRISIDDFGTGYSSLAYLRRFTVDGLKIDRSFVGEIAHSKRARAVAHAICGLARSLDITVVAEGVETEQQAQFFAELQCDELQGFLFARPLPVDGVQRLLQRHHKQATQAAAGPVAAAAG
jgi:diguanylate cyclase (GGDEF)-like protein